MHDWPAARPLSKLDQRRRLVRQQSFSSMWSKCTSDILAATVDDDDDDDDEDDDEFCCLGRLTVAFNESDELDEVKLLLHLKDRLCIVGFLAAIGAAVVVAADWVLLVDTSSK